MSFKDRNQAFQALIGVYDPINKYAAGFENTITFLMLPQMILMLEEEMLQME